MNLHLTQNERVTYERNREHIYSQTRDLLQSLNPKRWLDFGCGTGSLLVRNQDLGQGYGYDIEPAVLALAEQRGLKVFGNWADIPEVDCVVALDVVEHLQARELMEWLTRWHEKLPVGGHLLLASVNPECLTVWCEFWHDPEHVRPYTPACLTGMARSAGFEQGQITLRRMLPRRRVSLRFIAKILRGLDILPAMGSEFDRYWITYVRQ